MYITSNLTYCTGVHTIDAYRCFSYICIPCGEDKLKINLTGNVSLHTFRALLFVAHGVGEHMGRYSELIEVLIQNGILVFGHDQGKTTAHISNITS